MPEMSGEFFSTKFDLKTLENVVSTKFTVTVINIVAILMQLDLLKSTYKCQILAKLIDTFQNMRKLAANNRAVVNKSNFLQLTNFT